MLKGTQGGRASMPFPDIPPFQHWCSYQSESSPSLLFKSFYWGLPWWRSSWESACQCRGHGFEPWSGKIPHAAEQLGPWATTTEPAPLELVLCNKRGCDNERPAHRDEEWPPLAATSESPLTETKTHTAKNKNKYIKSFYWDFIT